MEQGFVFYDPSGKRWARFRRVLQAAAVLAVAAAVLVGLSVLTRPQLPALGLGSVAHVGNLAEVRTIIAGDRAVRNLPFAAARQKVKYVRSTSPVIHPKLAAKAREDQPIVFGYFVNWDPASMVSLRLNLNRLTHLVPEWLMLANGKDDVTDNSDAQVIQIARGRPSSDSRRAQQFSRWLAGRRSASGAIDRGMRAPT